MASTYPVTHHDNIRTWCNGCHSEKLVAVEREDNGQCTAMCCTCGCIVRPTDAIRVRVGDQAVSWRVP